VRGAACGLDREVARVELAVPGEDLVVRDVKLVVSDVELVVPR
jgi:hypothetical protein